MKALLGTAYAGNIHYYSVLKNAETVWVDLFEHFEKQSYRNRACIHGANGKLNLIIPLERRGIRTPVGQVKIDYSQNWQKLHWKSLESAYRSSPYFEYYEHDFHEFYHKQEFELLADFNSAIQTKILRLLDIEVEILNTESYKSSMDGVKDFRQLIHPKKTLDESYPKETYMQVFEDRNGFIPNLSILDLLFNEGPNAVSFL